MCIRDRAYAGGVIRPLARVFDCTTFYGAVSSATGFAYKNHHLFSYYGPYSDSRRRHARNWLRDNLPAGSYKVIIKMCIRDRAGRAGRPAGRRCRPRRRLRLAV